jgi:hypothetical protein
MVKESFQQIKKAILHLKKNNAKKEILTTRGRN